MHLTIAHNEGAPVAGIRGDKLMVDAEPFGKLQGPWFLSDEGVRPAFEEEAESGEVLFQDDFSNPDSGWDQMMGFDGETNYKSNEVYRIFVNEVGRDIWANPGLNFKDARIEVDATKVDGPDKNDFGIICRYTKKIPGTLNS